MASEPQTTDLVTRLRQGCGGEPCRMMEARSGCTCAEAADEIERLRAAMRLALKEFRLRGGDDSLLEAIGRASIFLTEALYS